MNRFYHPDTISAHSEINLSEDTSKHLVKSLRLKPSNKIVLFNGDGYDYHGEVSDIDKKNVKIAVHEKKLNTSEADIDISILQSVTSRDKLDFIFQKNTELGIKNFYLINTERVNFKIPQSKTENRIEHLKKVVISACEQSGRSEIPTVHETILGLNKLTNEDDHSCKLILNPYTDFSLSNLTNNDLINKKSFQILIGPEGGFSEAEIKVAENAGFKSLSLGKRVLRTETASLSIASAILALTNNFV
jgi:16S rRNA (uracil1498-N3)-methyltransferase